MISKISFGSTYKVKYTSTDSSENFDKFQAFSDYQYKNNAHMILKDEFKNYTYFAERTLVVPDSDDVNVEEYCKNNGIKFTKYTNDELLNKQNVRNRVKEAPKGYVTVDLDVKKFEEVLKEAKHSNVEGCEEDYNKYFKPEMELLLKRGDEFPTSALFLDSNLSDMERFVKLYGAKNLRPSIDFAQIGSSHNHCMYFALRDLGMKKVPVYVNEKSYNVGKNLGLF